jgi:hypothetical protein
VKAAPTSDAPPCSEIRTKTGTDTWTVKPSVAITARSAAAEARRLDMPGLLSDADAYLAQAVAAARTGDPLTPREHEIAWSGVHCGLYSCRK